ncbi:unnamed protein product [Pelagomonas calceolata]|uniref:MYND-type domain-containing protein n=1 Tax=Pelagomonas calceolata TaxID=35677 RepID=A0A8J2S789_9STRA|nr:unnamed protein product [Pelagomonas calceolata]
MILTTCAVCATELGLTSGKKCGRCSTRYCGAACQVQHWKEGGHDQLCKKIKKAGGAEQYNANKKYSEAVAVAATACAEDTKGQTCYICTEAVHRHTGEGLVRGCACHTTEGFVHVSCLAEQAKILVAEAVENKLGGKALGERFGRWHTCSLCEQGYHGVVYCALGWACWKMYVGRPETDGLRSCAMQQLGSGLSAAGHHEEELSVKEAQLAMIRRIGASEHDTLAAQHNLATTYSSLGRAEESLRMRRDVYAGRLRRNGEEHAVTIIAAQNYATCLAGLQRFEEAKSVSRTTLPVARRVLGDSDDVTLRIRWTYAMVLYKDPAATLDDLRLAVNTLEDLDQTARRVLGATHPLASGIEISQQEARAALGITLRDTLAALRAREAAPPTGDA